MSHVLCKESSQEPLTFRAKCQKLRKSLCRDRSSLFNERHLANSLLDRGHVLSSSTVLYSSSNFSIHWYIAISLTLEGLHTRSISWYKEGYLNSRERWPEEEDFDTHKERHTEHGRKEWGMNHDEKVEERTQRKPRSTTKGKRKWWEVFIASIQESIQESIRRRRRRWRQRRWRQ